MRKTFAAEAVAKTVSNGQGLDVTLTDQDGRKLAISLAPHAARVLSAALNDVIAASDAALVPTKVPTDFSVGRGRFEQVVLVRFENDVPYALAPAMAAELSRELAEEAADVALTPAAPRH